MSENVLTPLAGPSCAACTTQAAVSWRRRPTEAELADVIAVEQARRDEVLLLADPQLPAPEFGALPAGDDMTRTVYACATHAIPLGAAALVHASNCTAPNTACGCTPEAAPAPTPMDGSAPTRPLPDTWITG
ncbi:hypothetical protein ACFVJK_30505 [Streptomyces sp. NPDC127172]|uniref:hypothetical protein n=1 Tax=Streptomyces sp. NPDC127172 TaxID=3345382 RepID=UPI00362DB4D5